MRVNRTGHPVFWTLVLLVMLVASSSLAYGQGGTTSTVSGTVVDSSGAVVPGAEVTIKNNGTGAVYTTVTVANGTFSMPGINPGSYSVTVALMGFKTHTIPDLPVSAGVPAVIRAVLEVGKLEETVVVEGGTEIVQTAASSVATTLTVKQITNLPLGSREVGSFVINMPGVDAAGGVRDSNVLGLPQGQVNITIDGINVQDNTLKTSDGMFQMVSPRLDAMEEMTFSTAASGADAASQGAVQMRFTTRSGTNNWVGSTYYYLQKDEFNTNTYFNIRDNIPKPNMIRHQPGARLGGPIVRNRAFFFFNYEEYRQPNAFSTESTILTPRAQDGWFRYTSGGVVKEINVYEEAKKVGAISTPDPTVAKLLGDIRQSTTTTGTITDLTDPLYQRYKFQQKSRAFRRYPTGRFDLNLTRSHRFSASSNYAQYDDFPDTTNGYWNYFPGFPMIMGQGSDRYQYQFSVRSTFGTNLVNEARYGGSGGNVLFFDEYNKGMLTGPLANQDGYTLGISAAGITNAGPVPTKQARNAPQYTFEDSLTWLKGHHSFNFGTLFTQYDYWGWSQTLVPSISFGVVNGDPADQMFKSLSGNNLTKAKNLYAVLTGTVSQIGGNVRLNEETGNYEYLGKGMARARLRQLDFYAQDAWRLKPNLTFNLGVRYALQLPFTSLNSSYSTATMEDVWGITGIGSDFVPSVVGEHLGNLFTYPRPQTGRKPTYVELTEGTKSFKTDINNLAPALGFNWMPTSTKPFLRRLLGNQGDSSISGGYSVAYQRPGLSDFTGVVGDNPGVSKTANRNVTNNPPNLADPTGGPNGTLPVLFRDKARLGPPVYPTTRQYPMSPSIENQVHIFDPNLRVPYAQTYTVGFQRAVSKDTAVSVRYVGTRNKDGWTDYDYNEINIIENGFLNEFKLAQANLQANIAAGKGNTFAYTGMPGTSPLPIYLAFFAGLPASAAQNPANYNNVSYFKDSGYYNYLSPTYPRPFAAAQYSTSSSARGLMKSQTFRDNAIKAGLPPNFFYVNPDTLGGAVVTGNGGYTRYNSLQLELRRRLSQGVQFNASYVFGRSWGSSRYSFRVPRVKTRQTGSGGGVDHAVKLNWVYELPFGRGQRWGTGWNRLTDSLLGGWQFNGVGRIQSGRLVDFGNVRLVGMTAKDLQKMYKPWVDQNGFVWPLPKDVMENTVKAFDWSATSASGLNGDAPTGRYIAPAQSKDCIETISSSYGECGTRSLVLTGPMFWNFDMSVAKRIPIKGKVNFDFRAEVFNVFNTTVFSAMGNIGYGDTMDDWEILGTRLSGRTAQLIARINF